MKNKKIIGLFCALAVTLGASLSLVLKDNSAQQVKADSTAENMLAFNPGSELSKYVAYQRYEGYKLTLNGGSFTNNNSAFVLKLHTISNRNCGLTFYVNGMLMSGASTAPSYTYLYDGTGYRSTISHGSYGIGYFGDTDASYVVVPFSNFTNATDSVTLSNFTIAIRLKGVTTADKLYLGSLSAYLRDISVVESYTPEGELDLNGATSVYKPTSSNFTPFDSGNTGITNECMTATFYDGAAITYAESFNSAFESICDLQGNTNPEDITSTWTSMQEAYGLLSSSAKEYLKLIEGKHDVDSMKTFDRKYSYIFGKYGVSLSLENFVGRTLDVSSANSLVENITANNLTYVFIIGIAALSILSIVAFIKIKSKHN